MNTISRTVSFTISLGDPVSLVKFEEYKADFLKRGVYFLHEGRPCISDFSPFSNSVVYIGKAIGETIFSRCMKHRSAFRDERLPSGKPSMRPGKNFKTYRSEIGGRLENLWVVPGFMNAEEPYLISCAEEYLLHQYARENSGIGPRANSK
jgi:hypothetical protein